MKYLFRCEYAWLGRCFEVEAPMREGPPAKVVCPLCGAEATRVYTAPPVWYNAQGFHNTDYDSTGDKLEKLNSSWSKATGTKPPPPAKDVPKNSRDPY